MAQKKTTGKKTASKKGKAASKKGRVARYRLDKEGRLIGPDGRIVALEVGDNENHHQGDELIFRQENGWTYSGWQVDVTRVQSSRFQRAGLRSLKAELSTGHTLLPTAIEISIFPMKGKK